MRFAVLALLLLAAPAAAQNGAPFTIAETGQTFHDIDDAVQSVRMGTATILIAPGVYHQCTVQAGGRITFKAVQPGTAIFDGTTRSDGRRVGKEWFKTGRSRGAQAQ